MEAAVAYAILNQDPEPLTALRTGVPKELDRLMAKALAKKPGERYQHVDEMLVDLRILQGPPSLRRAALARKRLRPVYAALALVVLLAVVALLWTRSRTSAPAAEVSVVVLPLENLSGNPEQEYLSDGMTEALIMNLGSVGGLRVISRTSAMRYKDSQKPLPEMARELKVSHVLEGSVVRVGDRGRTNARLIEAQTDRPIWSENHERDIGDVLSLQSEVARAIARGVHIELTPAEQARLQSVRQVNPEAYQAYLRGRHYMDTRTEEGLGNGIEYFQQALAADPSYAAAYAQLAECYALLAIFSSVPPKQAMPKAREAAQRALELNEELAEAHAAMGFIQRLYDWDWAVAERHLKRAIQLNPGYATGHHRYANYLFTVGRL